LYPKKGKILRFLSQKFLCRRAVFGFIDGWLQKKIGLLLQRVQIVKNNPNRHHTKESTLKNEKYHFTFFQFVVHDLGSPFAAWNFRHQQHL
jgi:hypothetical protein